MLMGQRRAGRKGLQSDSRPVQAEATQKRGAAEGRRQAARASKPKTKAAPYTSGSGTGTIWLSLAGGRSNGCHIVRRPAKTMLISGALPIRSAFALEEKSSTVLTRLFTDKVTLARTGMNDAIDAPAPKSRMDGALTVRLPKPLLGLFGNSELPVRTIFRLLLELASRMGGPEPSKAPVKVLLPLRVGVVR